MDDKQRFDQLLKWCEHQTKDRHSPAFNTIDVTPKPFKLEFVHKMSWGERIDLFLISMTMLVFSLLALSVVGVLLYCFVLAPLFQ